MQMPEPAEVHEVLVEIRDNQQLALERQEKQLAIAEQQLERSRQQVEESIELQRQAMRRMQRVFRVAVPGIVFCIAMITYLVLRYF